jgi:hypothetical protein
MTKLRTRCAQLHISRVSQWRVDPSTFLAPCNTWHTHAKKEKIPIARAGSGQARSSNQHVVKICCDRRSHASCRTRKLATCRVPSIPNQTLQSTKPASRKQPFRRPPVASQFKARSGMLCRTRWLVHPRTHSPEWEIFADAVVLKGLHPAALPSRVVFFTLAVTGKPNSWVADSAALGSNSQCREWECMPYIAV